MKIDASRAAVEPRPEPRADLSTWLTRSEVCDLMHVSHESVSRWIRAGRLHPQQRASAGGRGPAIVDVIDPRELMQFTTAHRRQRPLEEGEIAARAFDMLEHGQPVRELVKQIRITPERAYKLREQWLEAGGEDWLAFVDHRRRMLEIASALGASVESCLTLETTLEAIEEAIARARAKEDTDMNTDATATDTDTATRETLELATARETLELELEEGGLAATASNARLEAAICHALDAAERKA